MLNFKTERLSSRVTRIYAFATELMYLVEGDKTAALLDTGSGIGSLKTCVDKLTDKPLIVLLTHGHIDHAMGAAEFGKVYMNRKDDYIYKQHSPIELRRKILSTSDIAHQVTDKDFIPALPCERFYDLKGGDIFDLGGITIEIYDCPGHTKGSVVMFLKEERSVLLGDACNYFTFMFDTYSTTITEYEEGLKKLDLALEDKYDTVYLSHCDGVGHVEIIKDVIEVCEDIKAGNTDDIPFEYHGVHGLVAKALDKKTGCRVDGGRGNIVYNKDSI